MPEERDPKQEDEQAGGNEAEETDSPKFDEALEKAEPFQKDAPGGGTHEEEAGRPAWGDKQGDLTGQEGKQSQQGGAPA
jgi:hypothetical protein